MNEKIVDETHLTGLQAYDAMLCFLKEYEFSGDISMLSSAISYGAFDERGNPEIVWEQGAWSDWLICIGALDENPIGKLHFAALLAFDGFSVRDMRLSALEAYDAMLCFLARNTWVLGISDLLNRISYAVIEEGAPSLTTEEQGAWPDWLRCVDTVLAGRFDPLSGQMPTGELTLHDEILIGDGRSSAVVRYKAEGVEPLPPDPTTWPIEPDLES